MMFRRFRKRRFRRQESCEPKGFPVEIMVSLWKGKNRWDGWFPVVIGASQNKGYNGDCDWHTELLCYEDEEYVTDDLIVNPKRYEKTYPAYLSEDEVIEAIENEKDWDEATRITRETEIRYMSDFPEFENVWWKTYGFPGVR